MSANASLEQGELWEISRQLVSFNTVSALSNVHAAEYLANYLEAVGFSTRLWRETVQDVEKAMVVAWAGPAVPGGLILSGHIDVVPFDKQPGWTVDPLKLSTDGQRIFGRGVSDMKVFLAQAVLAAKRLSLAQLKKPLVYILTCDEEVAGQGAGRLAKQLPQILRACPLPTVALIGEPTSFNIFAAHKGYATFDIHVRGKGGHSSMPHAGLNAIEKMADVIQLLTETNSQLQQRILPENAALFPASPTSTLNYGLIHGGLAPNMIAETCDLVVSMRIAPGDREEVIVQQIQGKIAQTITKQMQQFAPECGVHVHNVIATPPLRSPTDDAFCTLLRRIIRTHTEQGAPFATDGGQFQQVGINSYICGPGLLEEAHQPNESIPVDNFLSGLDKLEQIIHAWCIHADTTASI